MGLKACGSGRCGAFWKAGVSTLGALCVFSQLLSATCPISASADPLPSCPPTLGTSGHPGRYWPLVKISEKGSIPRNPVVHRL